MEVLNTGMGKIEDKIEMKVLENQMLYFWPYSSCDVYFTFSWRCLVNGWRENYRTQTEKERKKEREREGNKGKKEERRGSGEGGREAWKIQRQRYKSVSNRNIR